MYPEFKLMIHGKRMCPEAQEFITLLGGGPGWLQDRMKPETWEIMHVQGPASFSRVDKGFSRKVRKKLLANRCGIAFLKKTYVSDLGLN